jgi:hypothetical protein
MADDTNNAQTATQGNTDAPSATDTEGTPDVNLMSGESTTTPDATPAEGDGLMGGKPAEEGSEPSKEGDAQETKAEVPEKYESFNVEDGADIGYKFTDEQHEEFSKTAKEVGLTQEQAQKFVEFDIARQKLQAEESKTQAEADKSQTEQDIADTKKKYGDKYPAEYAKAANALKTFVPEGLQKVFQESGLVNNPLFFDMLVNLGNKISEDTMETGDKGAAEEQFNTLTEIFPQPPVQGG